jgi:hypothetical protein
LSAAGAFLGVAAKSPSSSPAQADVAPNSATAKEMIRTIATSISNWYRASNSSNIVLPIKSLATGRMDKVAKLFYAAIIGWSGAFAKRIVAIARK